MVSLSRAGDLARFAECRLELVVLRPPCEAGLRGFVFCGRADFAGFVLFAEPRFAFAAASIRLVAAICAGERLGFWGFERRGFGLWLLRLGFIHEGFASRLRVRSQ